MVGARPMILEFVQLMQQPSQRSVRLGRYFLIGFGLCLASIGLKILVVWAAETYLYSIPWVGGFLGSLEFLELSNLILLAMLGFGLGAATYYLPTHWPTLQKQLLLFATIPILIGMSAFTRHALWVQRVGLQANLSPILATEATDRFLKRETNHQGPLGFYYYTAKVTEPPTQLRSLQGTQVGLSDQGLQTELADLANSGQTQFSFLSFLFNHVGWGIRLIHLFLAVFIAFIYFFKGQLWSETL
jgi:hypothetical protein